MKPLLTTSLVTLYSVIAFACGSKQSLPSTSGAPDTSATPASDAPAADSSASSGASSAPSASAAPAASTQQKAVGDVWVGDIVAPKQFDPKPTLDGVKPKLVDCYKKALAGNASLHGRLKVQFVVEESGKVKSAEDAGSSSMKDASLASCVFDVIKGATFPKPGGTATVTFPLSFR